MLVQNSLGYWPAQLMYVVIVVVLDVLFVLLAVLPVIAVILLKKKSLPETREKMAEWPRRLIVWSASLVIGAYDGFYGPGTGTFLLLIFSGYICGITGKLMAPTFKWYVLFFYVLNFLMVGADLALYVRNYRLDKKNGLI